MTEVATTQAQGMVYVEGIHTELAVAVPEDSELMTPDFLDEPAMQESVQQMADQMGIPMEAFRAQMESMDAWALSELGDSTILRPMPTIPLDELEASFPELARSWELGEPIKLGRIASPVGDGFHALYPVRAADGGNVFQWNYWGESERGMFNLTVTARRSPELAEKRGLQALESPVELP